MLPRKPHHKGFKSSRLRLDRRRILRVRRDSRLEAWSRAVKERDEFVCRRCGGIAVHAHHVATRKRRPDLKYEVSNGIALCTSCHDYIHLHPKESAEQGWLSLESYEKSRKEAA